MSATAGMFGNPESLRHQARLLRAEAERLRHAAEWSDRRLAGAHFEGGAAVRAGQQSAARRNHALRCATEIDALASYLDHGARESERLSAEHRRAIARQRELEQQRQAQICREDRPGGSGGGGGR